MNNAILDTQTKKKNQKTLTFLHDSIRDYFAAESIQNCWTKEEKRARRYVRKRRYNPVWQETIVFLAGLLENPDALLRTLVKPLWSEILNVRLWGESEALLTGGKCIGIYAESLPPYGQKLLNQLIQMVDSNNKYVKVTAIKALAPIHSREAIESIIKCFTKSFIDNDYHRGDNIAEAIMTGSEEAKLVLIRALKDIDENVSLSPPMQSIIFAICYYLRNLNSVKILEEAVKICLKSKNIEIRETIFSWFDSWIDLLSTKTFPWLIKAALFDESEYVRRRAGKTCWRRFPSEAEQYVLQLLEDPECTPLLKLRAILTTHSLVFSPKVIEFLKQILFSSEPNILRDATIWPVFYECRSVEERKEILEKCVQDSDDNVRLQAILSISAFCNLDYHNYDKYLLQLLCDDDSIVSDAAARFLIEHGDTITVEKLKNLLNTDISEKASAAIRNTISAIEQTFLFSVDSVEFQRDLDKFTISEGLRQEFENNGKSLSQHTTRVWIIETGHIWKISDYTDNNRYIVEKEENRLNIYEKTLKSEEAIGIFRFSNYSSDY
ncbi:TPA: HEAT repeat domain-containing protein [Candidatus Bathyarchaeota archaeon]|nr:HEAT repeat domain-containing protein [Candidatus Bathyarchaeota archaeon]